MGAANSKVVNESATDVVVVTFNGADHVHSIPKATYTIPARSVACVYAAADARGLKIACKADQSKYVWVSNRSVVTLEGVRTGRIIDGSALCTSTSANRNRVVRIIEKSWAQDASGEPLPMPLVTLCRADIITVYIYKDKAGMSHTGIGLFEDNVGVRIDHGYGSEMARKARKSTSAGGADFPNTGHIGCQPARLSELKKQYEVYPATTLTREGQWQSLALVLGKLQPYDMFHNNCRNFCVQVLKALKQETPSHMMNSEPLQMVEELVAEDEQLFALLRKRFGDNKLLGSFF
eukprot:PhF_6_TR7401/c0_g1_i1/m.11107